MVSTSEVLAGKSEAFIRLHKALLKAFETFEHEQDYSVEAMQKYLELDTEVLKADAYSRYTPNPEVNVEAVQTFWEAVTALKYVESDIESVIPYIDETYYNAALQEMLEENPDNEFYKEVAKGGYGSNAE